MIMSFHETCICCICVLCGIERHKQKHDTHKDVWNCINALLDLWTSCYCIVARVYETQLSTCVITCTPVNIQTNFSFIATNQLISHQLLHHWSLHCHWFTRCMFVISSSSSWNVYHVCNRSNQLFFKFQPHILLYMEEWTVASKKHC